MSAPDPKNNPDFGESKPDSKADKKQAKVADRPKEVGGRGGLDPTRYGDWEKAGRCIDF